MITRFLTFAALALAVALPGTLGGAAWAAPAASPWGADYFPNVPLVTQDGKTVRFYDDLLKGKKVLINFIFGSCEQACPLDTANLARVQKLLGDRVGRDIFMYSITLDPERDTPQALKEYAERFGAGPGWLFLTGKREDIDALRFKLGERNAKEEHANTVRVGDVATGQWMRLPLTADPNYLVVEVNNTFYPGWSVGKSLKSIAEAPRPEVFGPGQLLFHNRCAACHTFGKGGHLGPDLKGVTERRQRDWLVRYLAAPDKMRAQKDPIALELARNHKVLMPNLSLTTKELEDLIAYLAAKSSPPLPPAATPAVAATGGEQQSALAHGEQHDAHHAHHDGHQGAGEAK
jgi:protein SCO1